ncbi:MAG: hypothetical protein ACJAUD_002206 [Crocinitomicaceae bacterium]|jgi:hypothetical protein
MKKQYLVVLALILSASVHAQNRVSLIETFTSSSCGPCVSGNINLEGILADSQNDDKSVSLKYQMSWPGNGDPYYTLEGGERRTVYGISGVPTTEVDGTFEVNTGSLNQSSLTSAYAVAPKATIEAHYEVDEAAKTITVQASVTVLENTPPGWRLYMAVFEYQTLNNTASNGETSFEHVMKKMLPNESGKVMSPMQAGETFEWTEVYTFNGNYTLPANALSPIDHATEHSVEEFSDLGVAVWVQTLLNSEVMQAGYAEVGLIGLNENESTIASAKIYPNPAYGKATVAFQATVTEDYTIEVMNTMGQAVYTSTLLNVEAGRTTHDLPIADFADGLYTVRISSATGLISKRLSVQN